MNGKSKALRQYREDAVLSFMGKAERRASGADDPELDLWIELFIETWTNTYHSDFGRNYDRYLQRLSPSMMEIRNDLLVKDFRLVNREHLAALRGEDVSWGILRENAVSLAKALEDTGDMYYTALAYNIVVNVHHPNYHEEGSNAQVALDASMKITESRDRLGLTNDVIYSTAESATAELRNLLGIADPNAKEGEFVQEKKVNKEVIPVSEELEASSSPMEVGKNKKPEAVRHASDLADLDHWSWMRNAFPKPGEQMTFPVIAPPVRLIRVDKQKFTLEAGAGETEAFRIPPTPEPFTVMRKHPDGVDRPFTLEICGGTTDDVYQGNNLNLEPTDDGGAMFYRSISIHTSETAFGEFTLYDTNSDGQYGYPELKQIWAEGLMNEVFIYRPDAMTLGKSKASWPFSRYMPDSKDRWYEVVLPGNDAPSSVELIPVNPNLGRIQYNVTGVKKLTPASILLFSNSSHTPGLVVDLAAMEGKEYLIPIGRYQFLQARFVGKDGAEVLVQPNKSLPHFLDVTDNLEEIVTLELGGPFALEASVIVDRREVTIEGLTLHLKGAQGQTWFRVIGEPLYEILATVEGSIEKEGELRKPTRDEAATQWQRLFYPMDAVFELRKEDPKPEITLNLKKHPWFGKISNTIGN
ncbi:MAG: hypothetical protein O3A50_00100 [Planctomycetota bacterium]|nr:hypothetical protein [Planctomycetota bacterium]